MMCQAAPVFFVPELSVLEQAQAFHFRHKKRLTSVRRIMLFYVIRLGFEPKTHSLEGCCSIQLSYRTGLYIAPKGKAATKIVLFILLTSKNQTVNLWGLETGLKTGHNKEAQAQRRKQPFESNRYLLSDFFLMRFDATSIPTTSTRPTTAKATAPQTCMST